MRLIVGLGNPGREYAGTRHNVGFDAVDAFAQRTGLVGSAADFDRVARTKFDGLAVDGSVSVPGGASRRESPAAPPRDGPAAGAGSGGGTTEKVLLLKPTTYMNLSGRSVQAAMAFYQLGPADVMVVLDDVALPCGKLRIRPGGSAGGHNGLKDIARALGTEQYPRLRIGVDPPPPRVPQRDWVLGRFGEDQRAGVNAALDRAVNALLTWIGRDINAAMNKFNADDK
ncbi:MAG: Peptidyl-tRNA hydrolase [uncultured Phycisphaerae bacterium]|uniref:Peptidyl-tRNA hydrolase n=1 Tax=uncultured Phycisphaerae bacterium TaxID=904963 RepID=A0A6J4NKM5_9BACT|nr:MAG: Peptidyl-tRNA hydrolase [uncultured Phycisphaerae bacterium]